MEFTLEYSHLSCGIVDLMSKDLLFHSISCVSNVYRRFDLVGILFDEDLFIPYNNLKYSV